MQSIGNAGLISPPRSPNKRVERHKVMPSLSYFGVFFSFFPIHVFL